MLSTVAVEVAQRKVPTARDMMARRVSGWFPLFPETLEARGHDTAVPRTGENASDLPRSAPYRSSERRSLWP